MVSNPSIDGGRPFDWGRASADYVRYRDIYPPAFYEKLLDYGVGARGQRVLDLGTGTGVVPRSMRDHGASWVGVDASEGQVAQARVLSRGMDISYQVVSAEDIDFPPESFDAVTACQCFSYFDHAIVSRKLRAVLRREGRFVVAYMAWLPDEDRIARASEDLVLKYSPWWSGAGETMRPISIPVCYLEDFTVVRHEEWKLEVPFTRESWNGRVKSCRGIGASLPPREVAAWEREHRELLRRIAPERFEVLHYAAIVELRKMPQSS